MVFALYTHYVTYTLGNTCVKSANTFINPVQNEIVNCLIHAFLQFMSLFSSVTGLLFFFIHVFVLVLLRVGLASIGFGYMCDACGKFVW